MDTYDIYNVALILLLIIQCWIMLYYGEQHKDFLQIIAHHLVEVKKKIQGQNDRKF